MRQQLYDSSDPESIERFGARLIGGTLRSVPGQRQMPSEFFGVSAGAATKGRFGTLVEQIYFGINPGNEACSPDFKRAEVELKTHSFVKRRYGYGSKERLVLGMIDYHDIVGETYESSCFISKSRRILLISRAYQKDQNLLDSRIILAKLIDLYELPAVDQQVIKEDWQIILEKVRSGTAHLISGSDTKYLEACTKGTDGNARVSQPFSVELARPRAFALKSGYITSLMRAYTGDAPPESEVQEVLVDSSQVEDDGFERATLKKIQPFLGLDIDEIEFRLGLDVNRGAKGYLATLSRKMFGVDGRHIAEFERAGITLKTIMVHQNGYPREHMSFPAFKYMGPGSILEEEWESDEEEGAPVIRTQLEQRQFCFVVFKKESSGTYLSKVSFWSMPKEDIRRFVKPVWESTRESILSGTADDLPGQSFNGVCHIRPHAKNSMDTLATPHNGMQVRKSFWLDRRYIHDQIGI